jgi:hypothetical protein
MTLEEILEVDVIAIRVWFRQGYTVHRIAEAFEMEPRDVRKVLKAKRWSQIRIPTEWVGID